MKKVITYGTFDLFHEGHYNLLKRAKDLGDYLIVGVTTDNFDLERGKMNTCDNVMVRIDAVRATGLADQIIIEEYYGQKIDDIQKYNVDIFTVGSDWVGKFDYLKDYCQVVYLPRTEGVSSTQIREARPSVKIGIIGTGSIGSRFVPEAAFVNSASIVAAYNPNYDDCNAFCLKHNIPFAARSIEELFETVDSVYIASPHNTHYAYSKQSLEAGKNVLCEIPLVFKLSEAEELYKIAERNRLTLMPALKTAYCPAFGHLMTLLKSGIIGEIVDVNASVTTLTDEKSSKLDSNMMGGSMSENASFPLLPIIRLLGTSYEDIRFYSKIKNEADIYTRAVIQYNQAVATFQVGLGVKTEGNLVVSGTKGYAYVPAPWWKTDYFEIRYEDQNLNKKYFYPYEGDGLRYEIKEFVSSVLSKSLTTSKISKKELLAITQIHEMFFSKDCSRVVLSPKDDNH